MNQGVMRVPGALQLPTVPVRTAEQHCDGFLAELERYPGDARERIKGIGLAFEKLFGPAPFRPWQLALQGITGEGFVKIIDDRALVLAPAYRMTVQLG